MKKVIELEFQCPVDVVSMPKTSCGHFCQNCQKEVVDFTNYTVDEIVSYKEVNGPTCGIYLAEQVDPDIIAPVAFGSKFKIAALFAGITMAISGQSSFGQNTVDPKKEQSQGSSNAPNKSQEELQPQILQGMPVSMSKGTLNSVEPPQVEEELTKSQQRKEKRAQKRLFRTRKAPYYKYRRHKISGY